MRERIQINNQPILEGEFAESFFEIWDRLEAARSRASLTPEEDPKPNYFRYLTLMAFHTFLKQKIDSAVIECGVGGEHDSTNILQAPTATGITSLGIDHTAMLGSTIEEIAWHKAGIMKQGVPALTAPQPAGALAVLQSRAVEKGVKLKVVPVHREIERGSAVLGLQGGFQKVNASLAVELVASHLRRLGFANIDTGVLPNEFLQGLREVRWGGRCETREDRDLTWHIDGGHTLESIKIVGEWFKEAVVLTDSTSPQNVEGQAPPRVLLFNQQTRAGVPLLQELLHTTAGISTDESPFTHAIFCTNLTFLHAGYTSDLVSVNVNESDVQNLTVQRELAAAWRDLVPYKNADDHIHVVRTIEEAVARCRDIARQWKAKHATSQLKPRVLATGSLHLVGGVLEVLETQDKNT